MFRHFAKRQVQEAVANINGHIVSNTDKALIGSPVLLYRPNLNKWDGPFSLLERIGEVATVFLPPPSEPTKLRTTVMKPFIVKDSQSETVSSAVGRTAKHPVQPSVHMVHITAIDDDVEFLTYEMAITILEKFEVIDDVQTVWRAAVPQSDDFDLYGASFTKEFNGLPDLGVFTLVLMSKADAYRIYNSCFVNEIKHMGTPEAFDK